MVQTKNDYKVESLVKNYIYLIATGKMIPGEKLPSIRQAEEKWSANRLTINKAYKKLEEKGYVYCKTKSGYFVADHNIIRKQFRFQHELDRLYSVLKKEIIDETGLSSFAVFRYMAERAAIDARENPEYAFVECTYLQALGHVEEIDAKLSIPVIPVNIHNLEGKSNRLPGSVKLVFTSVFHFDEMKEILEGSNIELVPVAIEVDEKIRGSIKNQKCKSIFLETEENMGQSIANDTSLLLDDSEIQVVIVGSVNNYLEEEYDNIDNNNQVLMSPRLWGSMAEKWRAHNNIKPVEFRISESSWENIVEALGLPLGIQPV